MTNLLLIFFGKLLSSVIRTANLGHGSTWPGHIALKVNPHFIKDLLKESQTKVVFVVGTNGKTTTTALLSHMMKSSGKTVIQNTSGANLINGISSTLLLKSDFKGKIHADFALFEVDENAFPLACKEVAPDAIIMLNLFRDQLDRYGEVHTIAQNWKKVVSQLPSSTQLILNADDPEVAFLAKQIQARVLFFSVDEKKQKGDASIDAVDSIYCPNCQHRLTYKAISFSHLGEWHCSNCQLERPTPDISHLVSYPLVGMYNKYNTHAAVLAASALGIGQKEAQKALAAFTPAFGRQEKIHIGAKTIQIFLSKNPVGFNESLRTIHDYHPPTMLLLLNDRVADGKDVSWIWDIDFETLLPKDTTIFISGDRAYDMAVRIKYATNYQRATSNYQLEENLDTAVRKSLNQMKPNETLYVLPTYTAMLDTRKILKGRKIL